MMLDSSNFDFLDALGVSFIGICVVMLELALIAVAVMSISKFFRFFESKQNTSAAEEIARRAPLMDPNGIALPATESQGTLDLINVNDADAAVVMAIVSNESGIPLNRLSFKSIKLLEDNQ